MSVHHGERPRGETEQLHARIQNLRHVIAHQVEKARRRRRTYLITGVCLVALSAVALGNLTRLTFALDAKALTEIGRAEVEKSLPGSREAAKALLEAEAPRLVSGVISSAIGVLPALRPMLVQEVSEKTRLSTEIFESQFVSEMQRVIQTTKSDIDQAYPEANEAERLDRLVSSVATKFNENVESSFHALYPEYSAEMERIRILLETLRTKSEKDLTPKEKLQKEIIQTVLRLAIHSHDEHAKAANAPR
jgi:hypothetical protein